MSPFRGFLALLAAVLVVTAGLVLTGAPRRDRRAPTCS